MTSSWAVSYTHLDVYKRQFYNQLSYNPSLYQALKNVVYKLFYTTNGVIGTPINVCYTYIVLFIIFGAFLERTGIANFFIAFANRLAGWSAGGPAKVAVISSALCGMVSGSSVGNTVTTGSVTTVSYTHLNRDYSSIEDLPYRIQPI